MITSIMHGVSNIALPYFHLQCSSHSIHISVTNFPSDESFKLFVICRWVTDQKRAQNFMGFLSSAFIYPNLFHVFCFPA